MIGGPAIAAIAKVELIRLLRSPMSFTLLLLVPAMQILLFGYAIRPTANRIGVVIAGPFAETESIARLATQGGFTIVSRGISRSQADAMVRSRQATIAIELPSKSGSAVRAVIDTSDPALTAGAEAQIDAIYWHALADRYDIADTGPPLSVEHLYNPTARADWNFLPALIGTIMMISMLMLGTLSMARERELGTWEALLTMPIGRFQLLVGKVAPHILIGTVQGLIVLALSTELFDLPTRGSIVALVVLMPLFAATHLVLGQALAARASSQLAALQGAVAFYLPAMLLSGFLYPFSTLPPWAQAIGEIFPLTHFVRASREATLRGAGAEQILVHGLPILAFLACAMAAALLQHRARLD